MRSRGAWSRRWMLVVPAFLFMLLLALVPLVHAHLTGAFSTYLAAVYNEETTQQLKEEMTRTEAEIAQLTPQLDRLAQQFTTDRTLAAERLRQWVDSGVETWAIFMQSAATVNDVLSNQWLIERELGKELQRLESLYVQYLQVGLTQEALQGHQRLLEMIAANLAMREPYLASLGVDDLETQAYYLDIDWVAEVEDELIAALEADRTLVSEGWRDWMTVSEVDGRRMFAQDWLNRQSVIDYHFRPDHIYAVFENDFANVILVAQVLRNDQGEAAFTIEGGFFNGFMIPELALEELRGFTLSYADLREATQSSERAYVEQASGRLIWITDQ